METAKSLEGMVEVRITGADLPGTMEAVKQAGICVQSVKMEGDLTIRFLLKRQDYRRLGKLAKRRGDRLTLVRRVGLYWTIKGLWKRPVLLTGVALLSALALYLPSRVLFVRVEGNVNLPDKLILEHAAESGVYFGASRRQVRSEQIKNQLLSSLPQLQWAGVNTDGCVAVLTVRERPASSPEQMESVVSSIAASRDGVILSCTVTRGNGLCAPGQAVKEGQVLISGYTDCGISISATQAEGEIIAATSRELEVIMPAYITRRREITLRNKKFSIIFGKKRINFYKDSGISDSSCVKIISNNQLILPGGLELPVVCVVERIYASSCVTDEVSADSVEPSLRDFAAGYLRGHMIAGSILNAYQNVTQDGAYYRLKGAYACSEMIGVRRIEKMGEKHEKTG